MAEQQRRCVLCQRPLADGEPAHTCPCCNGAYHAACWEQHRGCVRSDCRTRGWRLLVLGDTLRARAQAWYLRRRAAHPNAVSPFVWIIIGLLLLAGLYIVFVPSLAFVENAAESVRQGGQGR